MEKRRAINVYFTKEYKYVFNKNNKKTKCDYILNINKIMREKLNEDIQVMNPVQAFILNYEVKKLLDKAIMISNQKYENVIYINNDLSISSILNIMQFLTKAYAGLNFQYIILDKETEFNKKEFDHGIINIRKLRIINEYVK